MRIALIDGDVIAHIACKNPWHRLQCYRGIRKGDPRWTQRPTEKDDTDFSPAEMTRYINECWINFKVHIKTMLEALYIGPKDFKMAVKGKDNFRDILYPEYKAHRKDKEGFDFVSIVRDKAVMEGYAVRADGREADDFLRIWSIEEEEKGNEPIICSNDKDLLCIKGKHWNVKTNVFTTITELQSFKLYYEQLLKGDRTDNVPGIGGIGPIRATELLADCVTEEEFQETVVMVYQAAYPEDEWESYLLSNGKMIHIQRFTNDWFSISTWPSVQMARAKRKLLDIMEAEEKLTVSPDVSNIKINITSPEIIPVAQSPKLEVTTETTQKVAPSSPVLNALPMAFDFSTLKVPTT